MNYFVPPQGGIPQVYTQHQLAALQQMQLNPAASALTPQMNYGPTPQVHMLAPMGGLAAAPQLQQPTAVLQPRLVQAAPVAQAAQLSQYNTQRYAAAVAASQYQAVQAARQQAAAQRVITSMASSHSTSVHHIPRPASTPTKKDTVDVEVQTPEADVNPEADSSTKTKILNLTLAGCSTLVSTQYHHLQSRILTWGEKHERQALEVTRVKSDVTPSALITTPATMAGVMIFDDGTLQFCCKGKVLKSTKVTGSEEMDDRELREYLDNLGELYTFCCGYSEEDLKDVCYSSFYHRHNLLIRVQDPVPHAIATDCAKWVKVAEGVSTAEVRCPACVKVLPKLKKRIASDFTLKVGTGKRKHQAALNLSDIPVEPQTKKPKISPGVLMQELGVLQQQVDKFNDSPASENPMVVGKFLQGLGKDLVKVKERFESEFPEDDLFDGEEEEEMEENENSEEATETTELDDQNKEVDDEEVEKDAEAEEQKPIENEIKSEEETKESSSIVTDENTTDSNENEKTTTTTTEVVEKEEIKGEEALVNGTVTDVQNTEEGTEENSSEATATKSEAPESNEEQSTASATA